MEKLKNERFISNGTLTFLTRAQNGTNERQLDISNIILTTLIGGKGALDREIYYVALYFKLNFSLQTFYINHGLEVDPLPVAGNS